VPTTYVVYDTISGRIVAAHHFMGEAADPERTRKAALEVKDLNLSDESVAIVSVSEQIDPKRSYKVDVEKRVLVEVVEGDEGAFRFGFGGIQAPDRAQSAPPTNK
jgi:hypothetical protein